MKQHWGDNAQNDPPFLFGSNTLFRRDLLLEAGAYNEKYRNNFEDVDISNRLRKKGYRLFYEPRAVVRHLRKDNLSSLLNNFWKWNLAYYLKRGFYGSPERFVFKIKDNIGLSNRFLEEDLAGKRYGLLYLDFLIALHHSLRDFDYFSFQGKRRDFYISPGSKVSAWLSLLDLVFFYHFDQSKAGFATLMPKENMFRQNLFALSLVLSIFTKTKFNDQRFNSILYKHLFYSVHEIRDKQLLERLNTLTELRPDWNGFIKKEHPYIDKRFLDVLLSSFREWVDILIYRFPNIIGLIKKSARQAEAAMAAA